MGSRIASSGRSSCPPAGAGLAALTTAEGLGTWFGNEACDRPPSRRRGRGDVDQRRQAALRFERVEAPSVFGFTWAIYGLPAGDPRRTYVEFRLQPTGSGTRLARRRVGVRAAPRRHATSRRSRATPRAGRASSASRRVPRCRSLTSRRSPRACSSPWATPPAGHPGRARDRRARHGHDLASRLPITRPGHRQAPRLLADAGLVAAEPGRGGVGCATGSGPRR